MNETPEARRLVELFTADELCAIGEAELFAAIAAREGGRRFNLDLETVAGVEWTAEKRAAFDAYTRTAITETRGRDEEG